jgi:hypothetical protein
MKYRETYQKDIYADREGNVYSNKSGIIKPLKPSKVNNSRSKKTYWMCNYGLIHRLVASAWLGNVTGLTVNHIDGNPSNNCIDNLEIVTQKENHLHAILGFPMSFSSWS